MCLILCVRNWLQFLQLYHKMSLKKLPVIPMSRVKLCIQGHPWTLGVYQVRGKRIKYITINFITSLVLVPSKCVMILSNIWERKAPFSWGKSSLCYLIFDFAELWQKIWMLLNLKVFLSVFVTYFHITKRLMEDWVLDKCWIKETIMVFFLSKLFS